VTDALGQAILTLLRTGRLYPFCSITCRLSFRVVLFNSKVAMVDYFLRVPKFPIIVRSSSGLLAANNRRNAQRLLKPEFFLPGTIYDVIDATGEGFSLHAEFMTISPLAVKKRWTKKEIVELYNAESGNADGRKPYPTKSLSNKPLDRVIWEIAYLVRTYGPTRREAHSAR
jgi:hypothetical protein